MKKGELQQVASPQDLYDSPVNLFVAGFIGSPAMNFVDGAITPRDAALQFVALLVARRHFAARRMIAAT